MPVLRPVLDAPTRAILLELVRKTAIWALAGGKVPRPIAAPIDGRFGGAFVTFHRGPALRGCIGTFMPTTNIVSTLQEVTCSSLADPRFRGHPITAAELPELTIEISVLSDPTRTRDPAGLIPGVHGIIVRRGEKSGCFLPKVATERGWNAEQFLSQCCTMKSELPADAWRNPDTDVYLFTSESFSDDAAHSTR